MKSQESYNLSLEIYRLKLLLPTLNLATVKIIGIISVDENVKWYNNNENESGSFFYIHLHYNLLILPLSLSQKK